MSKITRWGARVASKQLLIGTFSPSRQKSCLTVDGRRQSRAGKDEKETQVRRRPSIGQQVQRTSGSRRSSLRRKNVGNVENVGVLFHAVELCPFEDVSVIDEALWNIAQDLPRSQKSRPNLKKTNFGQYFRERKEPKNLPPQQFRVKIGHTGISFCELCCH